MGKGAVRLVILGWRGEEHQKQRVPYCVVRCLNLMGRWGEREHSFRGLEHLLSDQWLLGLERQNYLLVGGMRVLPKFSQANSFSPASWLESYECASVKKRESFSFSGEVNGCDKTEISSLGDGEATKVRTEDGQQSTKPWHASVAPCRTRLNNLRTVNATGTMQAPL